MHAVVFAAIAGIAAWAIADRSRVRRDGKTSAEKLEKDTRADERKKADDDWKAKLSADKASAERDELRQLRQLRDVHALKGGS